MKKGENAEPAATGVPREAAEAVVRELLPYLKREYEDDPRAARHAVSALYRAHYIEAGDDLYEWMLAAAKRQGACKPAPAEQRHARENNGWARWERQREEMLEYVKRLRPCLLVDFDAQWMPFWEQLVDDDELHTRLTHPGKQRGTTFNRALVASIVCRLSLKGWTTGNMTQMARLLEGNPDHSVRGCLSIDIAEQRVAEIVEKYASAVAPKKARS